MGLALGLAVAMAPPPGGPPARASRRSAGSTRRTPRPWPGSSPRALGGAGLEPEAAARAVASFAEAHPGVAAVRVLDLPGKRLVASTAPETPGTGPPPAASASRRSRSTTWARSSGRRWRRTARGGGSPEPEIEVRVRAGAIAAAAPVRRCGRRGGGDGPARPGAWGPGGRRRAGVGDPPWLAGLLALAAALGLFLAWPRRPRPPAPSRAPGRRSRRSSSWPRRGLRRLGAAGIAEELLARRFVRIAGWGAAAGLALFLFVGLGGGTRTGRALARHRRPYLYAVPALLTMLILVFFPFFYGITCRSPTPTSTTPTSRSPSSGSASTTTPRSWATRTWSGRPPRAG
jgi:arabinogalactan oligomer / maltooligosaccharide transport system permease protein